MKISESTEPIRRKIIRDAEKQAHRLEAEAKDKATEILNAAKERTKEMREAELERRKKYIDETIRQRIAETKVEHHRRIQALKSGLIEDTFNKLREQLQKYVEKQAYLETLNNLIIEAGVALGGGELLIKLNETDRERLSKEKLERAIEDRTKTETRIVLDEKTVNVIGGAVVSTADETATIDNTFEARLERIKEEAKAELETILFR